jgi:hypothetical protein
MDFEVVPSARPSIITLVITCEDVQIAFDTNGESLRERVMLALIESLVHDISYIPKDTFQLSSSDDSHARREHVANDFG